MNEEELKQVKENLKTEKIENVIALFYICYDEIQERMKGKLVIK